MDKAMRRLECASSRPDGILEARSTTATGRVGTTAAIAVGPAGIAATITARVSARTAVTVRHAGVAGAVIAVIAVIARIAVSDPGASNARGIRRISILITLQHGRASACGNCAAHHGSPSNTCQEGTTAQLTLFSHKRLSPVWNPEKQLVPCVSDDTLGAVQILGKQIVGK